MISWIRDYALVTAYEDTLRLRLLEETDADSVSYSLASISAPSFVFPSSLLAGSATAVFALWNKGKPVLASISGITLVSSLLVNSCFLHSIRSIPYRLSSCIDCAKSLHIALRRHEQIRFSLGLCLMQPQLHLQSRVILALRRMIVYFREASQDMADRLSDNESSHLLSNFYTPEMSELVDAHFDESSSLNTNNAISTLLDLAALHTSEISRLYLLNLLHLTSVRAFSLFFFARLFAQRLRQLEAEFDGLIKATRSRADSGPTSDRILPVHNFTIEEKLIIALDSISTGISAKSLSLKEARAALKKVLDMDGLRPAVVIEKRTEEPIHVVDDHPSQQVITRCPEPLVDQVFEGFVDKVDDLIKTDWEMEPPEFEQNAVSLMGELRVALDGRSRDFEARERRALAAFYGITEEELAQREMESADKNEKENKEQELEATGTGEDEGLRPVFERRIAPLPSDLLNALAMRSRAAEVAIGDSFDSE